MERVSAGVQVSMVQADNFSWFGYPDDIEPSARNFLPGLAKVLISNLRQDAFLKRPILSWQNALSRSCGGHPRCSTV
jgi:hypothetical protein